MSAQKPVKGPQSDAELVEVQPTRTNADRAGEARTARLTVEAPTGAKFLNANSRSHRMAVAKLTAEWRDAANKAVPGSWSTWDQPVRIWCEVWKPVANRYDPGNIYPTAKACVDGFRDAGLIVDDDWKHVEGPHMVHGGKGPLALVFRIEAA